MKYGIGKKEVIYLVFNELIVKSLGGFFVVDVVINDIYFEWFCGDGFCMLIFSGIMVYNKLLGGVFMYFFIEVM